MKIFGDTHIGEVRKSNQDSFRYRILSPDLLYAVVCDGMGGSSAEIVDDPRISFSAVAYS